MTISRNFQRFQYFNFETNFPENENLFQKKGLPFFSWTHHFHTKLPYQKPILRQTEWWVQNGPIIKNGVLPVTALLFRKFCFSLRSLKLLSYKELIWCTSNPNAHILTFGKCWSFIWHCFFPVSILKKRWDVQFMTLRMHNCWTSILQLPNFRLEMFLKSFQYGFLFNVMELAKW